jgi:S1-C subfamily serine protease
MPLSTRLAYKAGLSQGSAIRIREVQAGSPADQSGLKTGDILVRLDAEPVTGVDDVVRLLDEHRIGKAVKLTVIRSSGVTELEVRPDEREREP